MENDRSFPQQHHLYSAQFMVVSNALWQLSARYYALVQALGLFFHFVLFFREDGRRSVFAAKETRAGDGKESGPMGKSRLFVQVSDFLFAFALPQPFGPIGKPHEFRAADATPDPGCIELKTMREMHPCSVRLRRLILSVLIGWRNLGFAISIFYDVFQSFPLINGGWFESRRFISFFLSRCNLFFFQK